MADCMRPSDEVLVDAFRAAWRRMSDYERAYYGSDPQHWPDDVWHGILMSVSPIYRYEHSRTYGMPNHRLEVRLAMGYAADFVPAHFLVRRDEHERVERL